jgi:hypothetical protein
MTNLLQQAIDCDDADRAARMIQDALGIESDDVVNYCFPMNWPEDRERRAMRRRGFMMLLGGSVWSLAVRTTALHLVSRYVKQSCHAPRLLSPRRTAQKTQAA